MSLEGCPHGPRRQFDPPCLYCVRDQHAADQEAEALMPTLLELQRRVDEAEAKAEILVDPEAFSNGYDRALSHAAAILESLPETLASRTRDEGRGVSFAASLLLAELHRLQGEDPHLVERR